MREAASTVRYRVIGMDCASDAAEIELAARGIPGVETVKVSTASHVMTIQVQDSRAQLPEVEDAVSRLGYQLDPLKGDRLAGELGDNALDGTGSHITAGYKRALWIVVLLNVGYGIVEMVGGFLSGSQALKADALDFLGDGLITFLGLLAIGWTLAWRARSALIQGLFLGALGTGVLITTAYRLFVQSPPEAELMGMLGFIALAVNLVSAIVLIPHRGGDANARAVWLFSRNDAIGNLAVIGAAELVSWTGRAWPDLVVAVVIAGLFLQSSWTIVRDARGDLREVGQ